MPERRPAQRSNPRPQTPRVSLRVLNAGRALYPASEAAQYPARPKTRADCLAGGVNAARPCPYVGCKHHLFLEVSPRGGLRFNYPGREPWQLGWTCALDVADAFPDGIEAAAMALRLTPITATRIRQIALRAARVAQRVLDRRSIVSALRALDELRAEYAQPDHDPFR